MHKLLKDLDWVLLQRTDDGEEVDQVDAPLAAFIFGYEGLRSTKALCDLML